MTTMRDVAAAAEVSVATVSAFVTGKRYVSPELKARIERAIEDLGYHLDGVARSLRKGSSDLVGLVIPDIGNPFFTEFVRDVEALARAQGFATMLADSHFDVATELRMLNLMRTQRVDGIILCPAGNAADYAHRRWPQDPPIVLVDNVWAGAPFDSVSLDNAAAGQALARHLLEAGHRAIAVIAGPRGNSTSDRRLAGIADTLRSAGIALEETRLRHADFREAGGYRAAREILAASSPRPTALLVANNNMLIGAMRALHDAGLRVPDDISVASIDDFPWAEAFRPALTVARQPVAEFAAQAFHLLRRRWSGEAPGAPQAITLAPELVVRESVARKSYVGT